MLPFWSIIWAFCLLTQSVANEHRQTWWVDKSCAARFEQAVVVDDSMNSKIFDSMMAEMISTVRMGYRRMSRGEDREKEAYVAYEKWFKHKPRPPQGQEHQQDREIWETFGRRLWGGPGSIQQFTKETVTTAAGRKASEVRIYCDNDARFELIPDGQEVIDKTNPRKNSKRHPEDQEWIDSINKIYAHGVLARGADAYAATYGAEKGEDSDLDKDPSNNPRRTSITLTNAWFSLYAPKLADVRFHTHERYHTLADFARYGNVMEHLGHPHFYSTGSMIMLHEFHHHSRYQKHDYRRRYRDCLGISKTLAPQNVENFVFFGVLMQRLEQRWYWNFESQKWRMDPSISRTGIKRRSAIEDSSADHLTTCGNHNTIAPKVDSMCRRFRA